MASIVVAGDTSGSVTLTAPLVAGTTTLTLPTANGTILTSATPFSNGQGPTFSSYPSVTQTLTSGVFTKLQYNLEEWDTANCYNTSDFRFTPNVAGYYQVSGSVGLATTSSVPAIITIYKNGSSYKQGTISSGVATSFPYAAVSALVYLNGTTDYVELYGYSPGGTLSTWSGSLINNYFQAAMVRSA